MNIERIISEMTLEVLRGFDGTPEEVNRYLSIDVYILDENLSFNQLNYSITKNVKQS